MSYVYKKPPNWVKLPLPRPGTKGHFDHHEGLQDQIFILESHTGTHITEAWQNLNAVLTTLQTTVTTLTTQVAAIEARLTALEAKVP